MQSTKMLDRQKTYLAIVAFHDAADGDDVDHTLGTLTLAIDASDAKQARDQIWEALEDEKLMHRFFFANMSGCDRDTESDTPCSDNGWFYQRMPLILEADERLMNEVGRIEVDLRGHVNDRLLDSQDPATSSEIAKLTDMPEQAISDTLRVGMEHGLTECRVVGRNLVVSRPEPVK